jgi:hypothetical protein
MLLSGGALRTISSPRAIGLLVFCAVSCTARSSEQPSKLVVTEGRYIGYATVADALATLKSEGLTGVPASNGAISFVEPDNKVAWTFAGKDDPAYPSTVRYVYTMRDGVLQAEVTILCEASAGRCEKFRSDIRDNLAQLSKKMAGDPSAQCRVDDNTMKCGAEPEGK